jgi:hypothetical protein
MIPFVHHLPIVSEGATFMATLTASEVRRPRRLARAAFPHFSDWDHNNEANESYSGFSLWGEFAPGPDDPMPQSFFVTLATFDTSWAGYLSVGKPCHYWTDADCGDANLVDADPCATLEEAIASLKRQMSELFAALSGPTAGPGMGAGFGSE